MLTNLRIRRFKNLEDVELELGQRVVLVGPNNSGKTSAMQALSLWGIGMRKWAEKRAAGSAARKRVGVSIQRRDLVSLPVPRIDCLWHDMHLKLGRSEPGRDGRKVTKTENLRIEIEVEGVHPRHGRWSFALEFDHDNDEALYCRPSRSRSAERDEEPPHVPEAALEARIAFLPAMSGLALQEPKLDPEWVDRLIGEGQTAQVLRNLCFQVHHQDPQRWQAITEVLRQTFGIRLRVPVLEGGAVRLEYEQRNIVFDISLSGRGMQQMLLLLAHLHLHPGSVLLLDEPDAHLEILRQREIYRLLSNEASLCGSQIIAATHSETILSEAGDQDILIAFVGKPHRIDDRGKQQVRKALKDYGFDQYLLAEQTGFVLYLEGTTDLAILKTYAEILEHPASAILRDVFFRQVGTNIPNVARDHFHALREAKSDLVGVAIFDRIESPLSSAKGLTEVAWRRHEIESYFCRPEILRRFARQGGPKDRLDPGDLFDHSMSRRREEVMARKIAELEAALRTTGEPSPWSPDGKASRFLDRLFELFYAELGLPNLLSKTDYHELARYVTRDEVDPEIVEKLDLIVQVAANAQPRRD